MRLSSASFSLKSEAINDVGGQGEKMAGAAQRSRSLEEKETLKHFSILPDNDAFALARIACSSAVSSSDEGSCAGILRAASAGGGCAFVRGRRRRRNERFESVQGAAWRRKIAGYWF